MQKRTGVPATALLADARMGSGVVGGDGGGERDDTLSIHLDDAGAPGTLGMGGGAGARW